MGWTLNGVAFQHQGYPTIAHADGNNAAWVCPLCGGPVLLVYQQNRIGSNPNTPSPCQGPGCGATYSLHPPYGFVPEPPAGQVEVPELNMHIV
jgi:hypothetical protein